MTCGGSGKTTYDRAYPSDANNIDGTPHDVAIDCLGCAKCQPKEEGMSDNKDCEYCCEGFTCQTHGKNPPCKNCSGSGIKVRFPNPRYPSDPEYSGPKTLSY